MTLLGPTQLIDLLLDSLPGPINSAIRFLWRCFLWVTLPLQVASTVSDLRVIGRFLDWLWSSLPDYQYVLIWMGERLHSVIQFWRNLTAPLRDLLFSWLPFEIPALVADLLLVLLITLPSAIRYFLTSVDYQKSHRLRQAVEDELARTRQNAPDGNSGTIGGVIGGVVGAAIGFFFPPAIALTTSAGAALGAALGDDDDTTNRSWHNSKLVKLQDDLTREEQKMLRAERRKMQAKYLLIFACVLVLLATLLIGVDAYFYGDS